MESVEGGEAVGPWFSESEEQLQLSCCQLLLLEGGS
jgi:hypothetical protein